MELSIVGNKAMIFQFSFIGRVGRGMDFYFSDSDTRKLCLKMRLSTYQIQRRWVSLSFSWYTQIGILLSRAPLSLRSCAQPFQVVFGSFWSGLSSKYPNDLGDVYKYWTTAPRCSQYQNTPVKTCILIQQNKHQCIISQIWRWLCNK